MSLKKQDEDAKMFRPTLVPVEAEPGLGEYVL